MKSLLRVFLCVFFVSETCAICIGFIFCTFRVWYSSNFDEFHLQNYYSLSRLSLDILPSEGVTPELGGHYITLF